MASTREAVRVAHGEVGSIAAAFAMTGAALLPGIKRAMGHAVACDAETMRDLTAARPPG